MISDIFFVLRTLLLTVGIVALMQVKVGDDTLEGHSLAWIHNSTVGQNIQTVAASGFLALQSTHDQISAYLTERFSAKKEEKKPASITVGNREQAFKLTRAKDKAEDQDAHGEQLEAAAEPSDSN